MKLNLSKTQYANLLGIYFALAVASMYFGSAPATMVVLFYIAVTASFFALLLEQFNLISFIGRRISTMVEVGAWLAAFPALIGTGFEAAPYWLAASYIVIYIVLRFGFGRIESPLLIG